MAVWSPGNPDAAKRAARLHSQAFGCAPVACASAPATWVLAGEGLDCYGGATLVGLAQYRTSAAVSRSEDGQLHVELRSADGMSVTAAAPLASLIDAPMPAPDESAGSLVPRRIAGLVHALIARGVLPRDTAGLRVAVASDIPVGAGLGALHAADAALTLAAARLAGTEDLDGAPTRTRLAEICSVAGAAHSPLPVLPARHTAALRGNGDSISVVDYADGSVTQAPHPGRLGLRVFSVTRYIGAPHAGEAGQVAERREFIDTASANFGVARLRQLPDAERRVAEWVDARREVLGADSAPEPDLVRGWVRGAEAETQRALAVAKALRSQRVEELSPLLRSPEGASNDLLDAAVAGGAVAARPAASGMSQAILAYVPRENSGAFFTELGSTVEVVEVARGDVAAVDTP